MKIVTIEGLRGSGKTSIVNLLRSEVKSHFPECRKVNVPLRYPFSDLEKYYNPFFANVSSSLGLGYYSGFFSQLSRSLGRPSIVLDNGMLSLPFYGYYGYDKNKERVSPRTYESIAEGVYETALSEYQDYSVGSVFFILEAEEETLKRRVSEREKFSDSDRFFLDNFDLFLRLKEKFDRMAKLALPKSRFIHLRNENEQDQHRNLGRILQELN